MASSYEPMSAGHAWHNELHSFLPHALDCVDPNCLLPLCVNLKLTLRHVQLCKKLDQCTICQMMKSLAATHSDSCRDFYCRVPFCMEAKVTTQQRILMDELVKTSDASLKRQHEDDSCLLMKETGQEPACGRDDASGKAIDAFGIPVTSTATTKPVDCKNVTAVDGCPEQVSSSDVTWPVTSNPQPGPKIAMQSPVSGESFQPEWIQRSPFRSRVESPKRSQSTSAQGQLQGRLPAVNSETSIPPQWREQMPSATAAMVPAKSHSQPGTKRKLQKFISQKFQVSIDKSIAPPPKVRRPISNEPNSLQDDCPEVQIVESKSSGRFACKVNGAATPKDDKNHQKRRPSDLKFLPRVPSRHHAATKQNKNANTMPLSPHPVHHAKRTSSSKTFTFKPPPSYQAPKDSLKGLYTVPNSSEMDFRPVFQVENQITDDSVDCYVNEMFSTPPPSPTFEMWLGETIKTNDSSALKTVLLETLFQLLGVVTQPKTEQQEAIFVDLLERTLRVMKTEIAK